MINVDKLPLLHWVYDYNAACHCLVMNVRQVVEGHSLVTHYTWKVNFAWSVMIVFSKFVQPDGFFLEMPPIRSIFFRENDNPSVWDFCSYSVLSGACAV